MDKKPLNKNIFCITNHLKAQVMFLQAGYNWGYNKGLQKVKM